MAIQSLSRLVLNTAVSLETIGVTRYIAIRFGGLRSQNLGLLEW